MDELDLIRSFRAGTPAPTAAATARAERAWRPAPARRPRRAVPRLFVAAALAAAAAAALVVTQGGDGRLGAGTAEAAATLRQAAARVRGLPRPLRPGDYWYAATRTRWTTGVEGDDGAYTAMGLEVREEWTAADGTRRWTTRQTGPLRFPTDGDRARWEADGRPDLRPGGLRGPHAHRLRARLGGAHLRAAPGPAARPAPPLRALPRRRRGVRLRQRRRRPDLRRRDRAAPHGAAARPRSARRRCAPWR